MNESLKVKFIISERIDNESGPNGNQNNIIVNPLNVLQSKYIPTALSFGLTIIISGFDINSEHIFEIKIIHKDTEAIAFSTGESTLPQLPSNAVNFNFNLSLSNVDIEHEGEYIVKFLFDSEEYSDSFDVIRNEQNITPPGK